jgi:acyl-CoA synthetase (AMP-forming)/AMP-acid ligase II
VSGVELARSRARDALLDPQEGGQALRVWTPDGFRSFSRPAWHDLARRIALGVRAHGLEPGAPVAAVLTNTPEACALVPACWMAGHPVHSLPSIGRGQPLSDYGALLGRIVADGGAQLLLADARTAHRLADAPLGCPVASVDGLATDGTLDLTPPARDDIAFVQYSSGSTSAPKGCALAFHAIDAHLEHVIEAFEVDAATTLVSWLPLSHDMGFFGSLLPAFTHDFSTVITRPERFVRAPQSWLEDMTDFGATATLTPNFGLALLARSGAAQAGPAAGSLGRTRIICGGERISWATVLAMEEALGHVGLTRASLAPAYGMAEVTLCATHTPSAMQAHALWVDRDALNAGEVTCLAPAHERALALVSCGVPIGDTEIAIEGPGEIGTITIRSRSRAEGYLGRPDATARAFGADGRLYTSDRGFVRDGELYVVGRVDDVIVHGGRNLHARDAEELLGTVAGVRPQSAVLLDEPAEDTARLVVVAEPMVSAEELSTLARSLATATHRATGARIDRCVFVKRGAIPRTPSGKLQRFRARALLADPGTALVAEVRL